MAIAKMEKLFLTFKARHLDDVLHMMQGFQGIDIETKVEPTISSAMKAEVDKDIREIEKTLQEIQAARNVLKGREPTKVLSSLRNSEEKKLSIFELTKTVEESNWAEILEEVIHTDRSLINNRTRRLEVSKLFGELEIWEHLSYNPLNFEALKRAEALFGSVHVKHADEFMENLLKHEDDGIYFEKVTDADDRFYFFLLSHNSMKDQLNAYLNEFSFSAEEYRFDKPQQEMRAELEREEAFLVEEETRIGALIIAQSRYAEILKFAEDYNLNALLRLEKTRDITYEGESVEIEGWIISEIRGQFEQLLAESLSSEDYQISIRPVKDAEVDEVPIKLKNNKLVTIYERLTELYSLPRYDEVDPTPVITIFYMIFYGMMVADIGYGLAVFLVGLYVKKVLKVRRSTKSFINFLYYLSFPMMGWGVIYGSFCGMDMPFGLISATVDIIPMIILSVALGYFHIMAGLVLNMINQVKLKKYDEMVSGGLAWFLAFLGGGMMILTMVMESDALFVAGAAVAVIGVAMIILVPAITYGKRWYAGLGKGLYALYGALSYLGDFVSYARLMALGVAGGSVALAFNTILGFLPVYLKFTLGIGLAVALHGLNIFLSMLSAYVHGMRLQFIEFFGKFYRGGGRRFEPFKAAEKNVIIINAADKK